MRVGHPKTDRRFNDSAVTTLDTYMRLWPNAEDKTREAVSGLAKEILVGRGTGRRIIGCHRR